MTDEKEGGVPKKRGRPAKQQQDHELHAEAEQEAPEPQAEVTSATEPRIITLNADLLSAAQKAALRKKARETVTKRRIETAEEAYLDASIKEAELVDKPLEQIEYIMLDLAGHSERLMIDGVFYYHGNMYEVPASRAALMREMVARGWDHELEVGGANRDQYRKPRNTTFSGKTGAAINAPQSNATAFGVR